MDYLRKEELDATLDATDRSVPQGRRDYALLLFLARTGARVSEAIGVNVGDLQLALVRSDSWQGFEGTNGPSRNGHRSRYQNPHPRAWCHRQFAIFCFCQLSRPATHSSRCHSHHSPRRRDRRQDRSAADLQGYLAAHAATHRCDESLQSGVDLTTIQSWLGHASVNTTHQYVEADLEMKRRALEKCKIAEAELVPYRPTDRVLALLEAL